MVVDYRVTFQNVMSHRILRRHSCFSPKGAVLSVDECSGIWFDNGGRDYINSSWKLPLLCSEILVLEHAAGLLGLIHAGMHHT